MLRKVLTHPLFIFALVVASVSGLALATPPGLSANFKGIVQARSLVAVDGGVTTPVLNVTSAVNLTGVANAGPVAFEPACLFSSGTTCTIADTTATALTSLYCGPLNWAVDAGTVTAEAITKCVLTQGTGWTCTAAGSTSGQLNCFRVN